MLIANLYKTWHLVIHHSLLRFDKRLRKISPNNIDTSELWHYITDVDRSCHFFSFFCLHVFILQTDISKSLYFFFFFFVLCWLIPRRIYWTCDPDRKLVRSKSQTGFISVCFVKHIRLDTCEWFYATRIRLLWSLLKNWRESLTRQVLFCRSFLGLNDV